MSFDFHDSHRFWVSCLNIHFFESSRYFLEYVRKPENLTENKFDFCNMVQVVHGRQKSIYSIYSYVPTYQLTLNKKNIDYNIESKKCLNLDLFNNRVNDDIGTRHLDEIFKHYFNRIASKHFL